ncbi:MAG: class I SAM-dependent methyltransferase [Acidobacteriota bacterium]|nr:MAG: class I SAM-dependent methyltransferase [Acidobacteriota bacterium]
MSARVPYDDFAEIYDVWSESASITRKNQGFYVRRLVAAEGPAVELGVGNGRICIEAAKLGKDVIGVDSSTKILALCETRAKKAGVSERLKFLQGDFRDFVLPEPADLITIPFHSIGHLLTREDKRKALANIYKQLRPGGRFIFDHFIFDPSYGPGQGVPYLRAEFRNPETGRDILLWEATTRDPEHQMLRIVVFTDDLDSGGNVVHRRYRRINLSWMTVEQSFDLLEEAGFEIDAAYGDFDEHPMDETSTHQVWVAVRR